jgi:WXG100 family type VII secretion target
MAFEVDQQTLHAAATDVRSTRSDVDGDLNRLRAVIDQLAVAWRGQAGMGFQTLMQRWNEDTRQLLVALDGIADMLDRSGTEHQLTDETQQQAMNRIHSALNP